MKYISEHKKLGWTKTASILIFAVVIFFDSFPASAANIDPGNDCSQHCYVRI